MGAARSSVRAVEAKQIPQPARTIRIVTGRTAPPAERQGRDLHRPSVGTGTLQIVRGLWSTASIADEVVEVFARQPSASSMRGRSSDVGQPRWERVGIPIDDDRAAG